MVYGRLEQEEERGVGVRVEATEEEDLGVVHLANEFGCVLVSNQDADALWRMMEAPRAAAAESSGLYPKHLFYNDFEAETLRKLSPALLESSSSSSSSSGCEAGASGWLFRSPLDVSWVSELGKDLLDPKEVQKPIDVLQRHRHELELPKVYSLPSLFQSTMQGPSFRQRLIESLKQHVKPEEMELEGVDVLSRPGARPFFEQLGRRLYALLSRHGLYPHLVSGSQGLEPIAAYIVGYSNLNREEDLEHIGQSFIGHPTHVDDCHLTINFCLGEEFHGGELYFAGVPIQKEGALPAATPTLTPATVSAPKTIGCGQVEQFPGSCLIHEGTAVHGAKPITRGQRLNLIVWFNRHDSFDRFVLLPSETKLRIAGFLDKPKDVARFSRTNRELSQLVGNSRSVWHNVLRGVLKNIPSKLRSSIKLGRMRSAKSNTRFVMEQIDAYPLLNTQVNNQMFALKEMIETEVQYITRLLDYYYSWLKDRGYDTRETPLRLDEPGTPPRNVSEVRPMLETLTRLFKTLLKFHNQTLPYLQELPSKQCDPVATNLLMCRFITNLIAMGPAYRSYSTFYSKLGIDWTRLFTPEKDPWGHSMPGGRLNSPVRRICKYPLLLREYNRGPGIRGWDILHFHQLRVVFDSIPEAINEGTRCFEQLRKAMEIQMSVKGSDILGGQTSQLVFEGILTQHVGRSKRERMVYLFKKLVLIARPRTPTEKLYSSQKYQYTCKCQLELDQCRLIKLADTATIRHAFELHSNSRKKEFLFSCANDEEKNGWVRNIEHWITEAQKMKEEKEMRIAAFKMQQ